MKRWIVAAVLMVSSPAMAQDRWAFEPGRDELSPDALLDLRYLNEDVAGEHGFIKLSDDGDSFVRGDAEPIRFWAVGDTLYEKLELEPLKAHYEFLAKRGVNMVRWHGQIPSQAEGSKITDIDEKRLDDLFKMVAAAKSAGVYVTVSPYYPHAMGSPGNGIPKSWGVPEDSDSISGLLYFNLALQDAYKVWLKELMTRENPYTGLALKDDPAVAILQMQNEDSLLFWTFNNIKGKDAEMLAKRFGDFATQKYGSIEKAKQAWNNSGPGDPVGGAGDDGERLGLANIWNLTQPRSGDEGFARRIDDQTEFLGRLMYDWHAEVKRYLSDDLGAPQLFNAGNWKTASDERLDDLERWSYTAGDVIGVNRYVTTRHEGQHSTWAIVAGDTFVNESKLGKPEEISMLLKQPAGHPMIVPETLWVPPNLYRAEGPLMSAVFQSIGGVDIVYWFSIGDEQWRQPSSANGYLKSLGKWTTSTPDSLGMFPAAALIWRTGAIAEQPLAGLDNRSLDDLWERETPAFVTGRGFDPNRDAQAQSAKVERGEDAFVRGPVVATYDDPQNAMIDADQDAAGLMISTRLETSSDRAYVLISKDAAGLATFRGTGNVTATVAGPFTALAIVTMDDKPLGDSDKILIQVGTTSRPTGWRTDPPEVGNTIDGEHVIRDFGRAPWQIAESNVELTIQNKVVQRAVALDPNGMPTGDVEMTREGNAVSLQVPPDCMYVVLVK